MTTPVPSRESLTHSTYRVPGMTCEHCRSAIIVEVEKLSGVEAVRVDLTSKLVRVAATPLSDADIEAAIDAAGYDAVRA